MSGDDETIYPVVDRSADRARIAATIEPGAADRDYAAWRERVGLPPEK
jgi:hypothetical protein